MSLSEDQIARIQQRAVLSSEFLGRSIAKNGITPIKDDPNIVKEYLYTKYTIDTGKGTNQAQSGRCWIYSALNWVRVGRLKDYGKDFEYSQNYVAFWDKFERANHFLETMIKLSDRDVKDAEVRAVIERIFTDGGEWELFENVVKKYGLVPRHAMPETGFSGQSAGYMDILKQRLRMGGGLIHKILFDAEQIGDSGILRATQQKAHEMKETLLVEVYRVLVSYLGAPPKSFLWQPPKVEKKKEEAASAPTCAAGASTGTTTPKPVAAVDTSADPAAANVAGRECVAPVETEGEGSTATEPSVAAVATAVKGLTVEEARPFQRLTPKQFLALSLYNFDDKVHLGHLPYHPGNKLLIAEHVTNMGEGKKLQVYNVSDINVLKRAIRLSIQAGQPVEIACEMKHTDRTKALISDDNDQTAEIFDFDSSIVLPKGDQLQYGITVVAHGMVLIGCDDEPSAENQAPGSVEVNGETVETLLQPLGPLWKVENSWKDLQYFYLTDSWFDKYCYDIVVDRQFVEAAVLEGYDAAVKNNDFISLSTTDPFCKI